MAAAAPRPARRGRANTLPEITIHYAQTLDGRIATRDGQSQWVSGEASLRFAHELRAAHEAVLVGVGTVIADNPRLTVRLVPGRSPRRVVLDSTLRMPFDCNLLTDGAAETIVVTTDRAPLERRREVTDRGGIVLLVPRDADERVDLRSAVERLGQEGIASILIEGGRGLITAALREGLVRRLTVCLAPKVLGRGIEAVGDLHITCLAEALTFESPRFFQLGEDLIFDGRLPLTPYPRVPSPPAPSPGPEGTPRGRGSRIRGIGRLRGHDVPIGTGEARQARSRALSSPPPRLGEGAGGEGTRGRGGGGRPRALWFPGPHQVEIRDEGLPDVGLGEVRVRAIASAISHGTEMLVFRGQVPPDLPLDLPTLRGSFSFPIKYGYASVGEVVEVGQSVDELHPGDRVFVHHPHQTEYVVAADRAIRLPTGLDPELGVFLANLETALNITLDAHPRMGERLVIFGQGVVGLLLTQLARRVGAGKIIVVDPLATRRELALELGADQALAPDEDVAARVRDLTEGVGIDLALEVSGNPRALQAAIDAVAFQGTVVVCSWYGTKPATLGLGGSFHRGRVRLVSSQVSSIDPSLQPRWSFARRLAVARDLLPSLPLSRLISHRLPFEQAQTAYRLVDEHPEDVVQVVLTYT